MALCHSGSTRWLASERDLMDAPHRSGKLVVVEVRWEQKPGNPWLLRQVFDLLLRDPAKLHPGRGPDLTQRDVAPTMELQAVLDEEGGKR